MLQMLQRQKTQTTTEKIFYVFFVLKRCLVQLFFRYHKVPNEKLQAGALEKVVCPPFALQQTWSDACCSATPWCFRGLCGASRGTFHLFEKSTAQK